MAFKRSGVRTPLAPLPYPNHQRASQILSPSPGESFIVGCSLFLNIRTSPVWDCRKIAKHGSWQISPRYCTIKAWLRQSDHSDKARACPSSQTRTKRIGYDNYRTEYRPVGAGD